MGEFLIDCLVLILNFWALNICFSHPLAMAEWWSFIGYLMTSFLSWCSGDTDSVVPVTATRFSLSHLNLTVKTRWYPWYSGDQVMHKVSHESSFWLLFKFDFSYYFIAESTYSSAYDTGWRMDRSLQGANLCNCERSRPWSSLIST